MSFLLLAARFSHRLTFGPTLIGVKLIHPGSNFDQKYLLKVTDLLLLGAAFMSQYHLGDNNHLRRVIVRMAYRQAPMIQATGEVALSTVNISPVGSLQQLKMEVLFTIAAY
jgi:hypothetical protein